MCTAVQYKELTATRAAIVQKHGQSLGSLWGDRAWGQGRWKDPSAPRARIWVCNWEGGGSRKEQEPGSWRMPEGKSWTEQAGQKPQCRVQGMSQRSTKGPFWGAFVPDGRQCSPLPAATIPSPLDVPAPAAMAVTSAGCSVCSQSQRTRN